MLFAFQSVKPIFSEIEFFAFTQSQTPLRTGYKSSTKGIEFQNIF